MFKERQIALTFMHVSVHARSTQFKLCHDMLEACSCVQVAFYCSRACILCISSSVLLTKMATPVMIAAATVTGSDAKSVITAVGYSTIQIVRDISMLGSPAMKSTQGVVAPGSRPPGRGYPYLSASGELCMCICACIIICLTCSCSLLSSYQWEFVIS